MGLNWRGPERAPPGMVRSFGVSTKRRIRVKRFTLALELVVELHRGADFFHRRLRHRPAPPCALDDDLAHLRGPGGVLRTPLADRRKERAERLEQPLLDLDVAYRALAIALLELLDLGLIRVEDVVVGENRIALDVAGVGGMDAGGIGEHR